MPITLKQVDIVMGQHINIWTPQQSQIKNIEEIHKSQKRKEFKQNTKENHHTTKRKTKRRNRKQVQKQLENKV